MHRHPRVERRYGDAVEEAGMNQDRIVMIIDESLERYAARDLIAGQEVVDFLLDLRLAVLDDTELRQLLDDERQPTA